MHAAFREKGSLLLVSACLVLVGAFLYDMHQDIKLLKRVQAGEDRLICWLSDGLTQINPDKVKDFVGGTWVFTNGYSTNCKVDTKKR